MFSSSNDFESLPEDNSLLEDFGKLLHCKKFSDVSFSVGGEVITAHKVMLAARSPVFLEMFVNETVENRTGVIKITDMEVETLKMFLEFVYTADLKDLDWKRALDLMIAANKYQVPTLKMKCILFLKCRISEENVCDVVSVADLLGEKWLKQKAIDYIRGNHEKVLSSQKWSEFFDKNVKLFSEIFSSFPEGLKAKYIKKNKCVAE